MSKGTPKVVVRLPAAVRANVEAAIANRNRAFPAERPATLSDWILDAIMAKLTHLERGRRTGITHAVEDREWNEPRQYRVRGRDGVDVEQSEEGV